MEVMVMSISTPPEFHTAQSIPPPHGEPFNYDFRPSSAPTSPARSASIYHHLSQLKISPEFPRAAELFDFAVDSDSWSEISTADELFEKGIIRPLHPLPSTAAASASPRGGARERQRSSSASISGKVARDSRSLSPVRKQDSFIKRTKFAAIPSVGGSKKWSLKDLLLFRSASEGRATGRGSRDPLRKYTLLSPVTSFSTSSTRRTNGEEDLSSRTISSKKKRSGLMREGGAPATSVHVAHYAEVRAAAAEQRKKTPLPYQGQGLFGCLQFNPAIRNIAKGLIGKSSPLGR